MKKPLITLAITSALISSPLSAVADTLIHAGKVFTGTSKSLQEQMTIVIEGNKITGVKEGFAKPQEGDTVIDLSTSTVMPGLMDMHVHLSSQHGGPQTYLERFSLNEADYALRAANYAEITLDAGFTTVRNLGDGYNETVALRLSLIHI